MKKFLALAFICLAMIPAVLMANGESETPASAVATGAVDDAVMSYFADMPSHIYKIGQADFVAKVNAGDDMVVLDIRQPDVYGEGHVRGAVNLPWGPTALPAALTSIPQDKEVFVYCYTGQTAGQAVMLFNAAGINARSVNLGWNFGISRTEGIEAVTETAANTLPAADFAVNPEIADAFTAYFAGLSDVSDTIWKNYKVSEANAKKILDAGETDVAFVSVRAAKDYAEGHIDGAMNVPWGKGMQDMFANLPADKTLIVYCYTGQTAGQTVAGLKLLGYDAVSLNGGMGMAANAPQGWSNQGLPVVQ